MIDNQQDKIDSNIKKMKLDNKKAILIKLLDRYNKLDRQLDYIMANIKEGNTTCK